MNSIIVCDDLKNDRKKLIEFLNVLMNFNKSQYEICEYESAEQLLEEYATSKNSLMCFLDVYMKEMNGIDLAKKMRENGYTGEIVFTTTSTEFAMESYDVNALYYLVKPYSTEKVRQVYERYQRHVEEKEKYKEPYILLKCGTVYEKVSFDNIEYIESNNTILNIHLTDGKKLVQYGKLSDLEAKLADQRFLRCHQSYLVNMDYIVKAETVFIMESGNTVLIRQKELHKMKEHYFTYLVENTFL